MKSAVKRVVLGPPGARPRAIRRGLLRGLSFSIDTGSKSLRLLGFDEREIAGDVQELAGCAGSALDIGANDGWNALYFASRPNMQKSARLRTDSLAATNDEGEPRAE